ncbi:MAG: hypothetical protein SOU82_05940 [Alloprevotella sp.]|nr:hypothetical protein [Prevotellamassilia sp.]MDY2779377.1 hypothetical protein [Alloprevotella sp.]MDY4569131.1 hypothetical protein [Alloprevotella sp.]
MKCKVCGTEYPDKKSQCPRCGCRKGETIPANLKCKRCGTTFSSRHKTCPACGIVVSPTTAEVAFLPPSNAKAKMKQRLIWGALWLGLVLVCIGEAFLVKAIYARSAQNTAKELWEANDRIEDNRREPDPIYKQPVVEDTPDSLINDLILHDGQADSLNTNDGEWGDSATIVEEEIL